MKARAGQRFGRRLLSMLTAVVTAVWTQYAAAQSTTQPTTCDDPAFHFSAGPRQPGFRTQADALTLVSVSNDPDKSRKAASLLPAMRGLVDQVAKRAGDQTLAALLKSDLSDLLEAAPNPDQKEIESLRRQAFTILATATTAEAVEVSLVLDAKLNAERSGEDGYRQALGRLNRHRQFLGDIYRSAPLWTTALAKAPSATAQESLARDQLRVARKAGHTRWLLKSQGDLMAALLRRNLGDQASMVIEEKPLRHVLRGMGAGVDELKSLARAMLPALVSRATWYGGEPPAVCYWLDSGQADLTARVVIATGSAAEARDALGLAVRLSAAAGVFQTEPIGAAVHLAPMLAARSVDRGLYLEGMRKAAVSGLDECKLSPQAPELCALQIAAATYVSIGAPAYAGQFLGDALDVAASVGASPVATASLLTDLAEMEWAYGTASQAPGLLARAESLVQASTRLPATETEVKILRLRALIADAQLEDDEALSAFGRIVAAAIPASRTLSPETTVTSSGNSGAHPLKQALHRAATELTRRHLRHRFCSGCGGPNTVAQPALDWIAAVFDAGNPRGFLPSEEDFLLLDTLPRAAWGPAAQRRAQEQFRKALTTWGANDGAFTRATVEAVKRRLPAGSDPGTQMRAVALTLVAGADTTAPGEVEKFLDFLIEKDLGRKRSLWKTFVSGERTRIQDNFGTDGIFYEQLDTLARAALSAGYPLGARVVFEWLLEQIASGASNGMPSTKEGATQLRDQAALAIPALARLAVFAADGREAALAHRLLDLAQTVLGERLGAEWRTGNERAAASLREFRAAARLLAQTRARLLLQPAASAAVVNEAPARLFSDLQVAMLSETALASQAADRRRLAVDPELAATVKRRDDLGREIASTELLRVPAERYGLVTVDETVRRLSAERSTMAAAVVAKLPVPEDLISPTPFSLSEARRVLDPDEAVLVLHAGTDAVFGFLATAGREPVTWIARMTAVDLEKRIRAVRDGVDVSGGTLPRFPFEAAAELHAKLLGPAREALTDVRHLLVVSDGPLQSLPFSALVTEMPTTLPAAPDEIRSARVPWLARRFAVTVLPSVRSLTARGARRLASQAKLAFAGIGNPVLGEASGGSRGLEFGRAQNLGGTADVGTLRRMASLPETETEIRSLGRSLNAGPGDLVLGPDATEAAVRRMDLSNYRIVTFATHGLVAGAVAGSREPGLVLTPPEQASESDDGFLSASEIAALKLDADLVILSACNTASPDGRPRAEGLSGLARAFMSAGARSVVATHWAIPSEPTVEVTTRLVRDSGSGDWGRALRRAMMEVADDVGPPEYAHPANWGAFVAVGLPPRTSR